MKLYLNRNIFNKLLELVIILITFPLFFSKEFGYKLTSLQLYSEIKLTINGKGNQNILNTKLYEGPQPEQILINGDSQIINNEMTYNFTKNYNNVTLIWNSPLIYTDNMFYGLSAIRTIVISHFDSTELKSINSMFSRLMLLTSIDLSNFDTSLVTDFRNLFAFCKSLKSLDLSNFKTSNAEDMECMFFYCVSLRSLDLSNFDTSKVTNIYFMFSECQSLIYLNLKSFTEESIPSRTDTTFSMSKNINITFCINETKAPIITSMIQEPDSNLSTFTINCSDTCFLQQSIVLINESKCISCYELNTSFQFIYNNCYLFLINQECLNVVYTWACTAFKDGHSQLSGVHLVEPHDAFVADGCGLLLGTYRQPFPTAHVFKLEFCHTLSEWDVFLQHQAVHVGSFFHG